MVALMEFIVTALAVMLAATCTVAIIAEKLKRNRAKVGGREDNRTGATVEPGPQA